VRRAAAVALATALCACASAEAAPKQWPRAFRSCDALLTHARSQALRIAEPQGLPARPQPGVAFPLTGPPGPRGGEGDAAAPQAAPSAGADAPEHSTTNVQEKGVDEPDLVKTDGKHVFALANGALRAIDVRGGSPKVVDSLRLDGFGHEMLIHGGRILVFTQGAVYAQPQVADFAPTDPGTKLVEVDASDPSDLRVVRTLDVDGSYVSARLTGATARVVLASFPRPIPLADVEGTTEQRRRAAIRRTRLKTWVPSYKLTNARTGGSARRSLVRCRATRRPATFAGLGMLTVLTIDLSKSIAPVDSDGLITDARTVYASPSSLYVASERWFDPLPESADQPPPAGRTTIHRFDTRDGDHTTFRSSGDVRGHLLNQWSLSEHRGHLRVATTEQPQWWNGGTRDDSESFVTVLRESGGVLGRVGAIGGLGLGERIYAVRFIEDRGYVVTFRQVDPLYVLSLADPQKPSVAGELKILGYSAYLHPIGDDLLLGIGQDATEEGRLEGTQLSVFDVSDPAKPARLHQRALGSGSSSEAEYDHHAFLWWPPAGLAVVPLQIHPQQQGGEQFTGAIGFRAGAKGIDEAGRVSHPGSNGFDPPVRRALVIGDRLFTVSDAGIRATHLATFGDVAFAAFGD
jgi:uncharacterized secreted protein with C-terminal beta-propeller domain